MTVHDRDLYDELVRLRRSLHADPEIGLQLPRTQEKVLGSLAPLDLELSLGRSSTSITAVLRGGSPGPAVLLRGDMDALPLKENTGLSFTSRGPAMHACGHDLHTAMLVGAAHLLHARRSELAGDVIFMFQPGEEGYNGAGHMIKEGVLTAAGDRAVAAYALHVQSGFLPGGIIGSRPGPLMASSDTLRVTVVGRGGHGCAPHRAADPIQAMCAMVTTLQTFVTRELDVFDPAVITVGRIQGGTAGNIIPETASFEATVRSFSIASRDRLQSRLPALCQDIARAHGVRAEALFDPGYPATTNDERETVRAMATAAELLGDEAVQTLPAPLTGSEDFSRVLNEVPGAMLLLGATAPGQDPMTAPPNHSPQAHFEESVLVPGATLYSELALGRLAVSE